MKHYQAQLFLSFFLVFVFFCNSAMARKHDDCPAAQNIEVFEGSDGNLTVDMDIPGGTERKLTGFTVTLIDMETGKEVEIEVEGPPPFKLEIPNDGGKYAFKIQLNFEPTCAAPEIIIIPNEGFDLEALLIENYDGVREAYCNECITNMVNCIIANSGSSHLLISPIPEECECAYSCQEDEKECCHFIQNNFNDLIPGALGMGFSKQPQEPVEPVEVCSVIEVCSPNPFDQYMNVSLSLHTSTMINFSLFDIHGQKVYDLTKENHSFQIEGKYLKTGIYYLRVESEGCSEVRRIVKTN